MANDVQDVTMKIKPEIDTSDINRDMKKVADTTKGSLEQSISKFNKQLHKSLSSLSEAMTDIKGDGSNDMFTQANIALEHMQNMLREIKNMDAVDSVDAKVYVLGQQVMHTAEAIGQLHKRLEDVKQTAEVTNLFESQYGNVENAENELEKLQATAQQLRDTLQASGVQAGPINLNAMEEAYHRMEVLRTAIQSTKDDISTMNERADKGTEEWKDEMEVLETVLTRLTSKLGNASRQFYSMGRKAGFGDTKSEILDMYNLAQQSKNAERDIKGLTASIEKYKMASANTSNAMSDMSRLSDIFERQKQQMQEMAGETANATNNMEKMAQAASKARGYISKMRNTVWAMSRLLGNFYTLGLDIVRSAKMIANYYKRIFGYIKQVVGWAKRLTASIKGTADEHKKSWKQMLRDIIRYSFGIRSLFMLFRRLRRYIKEAFEAMAEQIPEVNTLLNELKSSLGMLKGSLATAFEPILSAIAPALLQLIDLLARAITYIGMFFAAFTGRGYVYKATKAIQGMAGAAKELNKQLQGFDELNNLTSNNDNGSGSGPLAMFEKVDVPDWIKKIVDFVKKVLAAIWAPIKAAWDNVKDYVINSWKYAMHEVKELLLNVLRDFLIAWQELGQGIFEKIFKTVGNIGRIVGNIAKALRRAWNYNQNGLEIWRAILTIIDEVVAGIERITDDMVKWTSKLNLIPVVSAIRKWLQSLIPVVRFLSNVMFDLWDRVIKPILTWAFDGENSGIARLFDIFKGFNEKVDWNKLRENLQVVWDAIGRFGQTVGEGLLIFIERMADNLANWINSDDFVETCNAIADFLDNISAEDVADDLEHIFNILSELVGQVYDALSYVIEHKDEILDFAEKLAGHLDTIVKIGAFGKLAIDIGRFLANTFLLKASVADLTTAVKGLTTALGGEAAGAAAGGAAKASGGLMGALGPLLGILAGVAAVFAYLYTTNEKFRASIDESIGKMTEALDQLKKSLGNLLGDVDVSNVKELFDKILLLSGVQGALEGVVAAVAAFVQLIADLVDTLSSGMEFISNLGATIRDLFSLGWSTFTGDIDGAGTALTNFVTDMQNAKKNLTDMFDSFKQSISDAGNIFGEFFDKYFKSFSGLSEPTKSKLNSIIGFFESFANGVIDAMNAVSSAVAGVLSFDVPDWVPLIGGNGIHMGGTNFGHITIPRLAQGAVIPPNREFLAVLGDQKRGTNIESPLSTMVEAFNMANKGGNEQELALLQEQNELLRQLLQKELTIGDNDIFKSVRRSNKQFTAQNGYSAFA